VGTGTGWTGVLGSGQCFVSPNGRYELLMQGDGDLVIYDRSVTPNQVLWSAGTATSTADPGFAMRTFYSYDALGNLLRVDQKGSAPNDSTQWRTRTFTYDSLSRLLTATNPESGTITYSYDADGNLLQKTSPAPNQTGTATQIVSYCYDELHRVTGKGYGAQSCPLSTPVVSYAYDSGDNAIGKLTSLTDQAGTDSYTYDVLGRLTAETRTIAGVSKSTSYSYNLGGSVKTLTYPSGRVVTYTPDSAGRLLSAVDGNGTNYVTSASYNPDGSLKSLLNGSTPALNQNFQYTPRLQLCRITVLTSGTLPTSCTDSQNIGNIMDRGYDFHAGNGALGSGSDNGNVFGITNYRDTTRSQSFTYDALNRLASGWSSADTGAYSWGENYSIDAWGNLQISPMGGKAHGGTFQLSGNAQNRPTGLAYDAAGNLLSYLTANYTYDEENRLLSAAGMTYMYDGNGERVLKANTSTGAAVKRYWSMGGNTLAEDDGSGNLTAEYVYFGGKRLARIDLPANTVHYYLSDHLGSTSIVASAGGTVEAESDYYPFGTEVIVTGPGANELKFTGKRRDTESQLDYFGARYYSNVFGRFMKPDEPFADQDSQDAQSWNLYVYAANNPIRYNDPTGASHVDEDGWTVGDFNGELINNGTLYWDANNQVWTNPPLTDDQQIMQGATAIANLTSLESISDLGINGINDAMLVESLVSLPATLRSGATFINSFKNGVKMAGVRAAGQVGESLVQEVTGFAKNTEQITSTTGTAAFRVPDVLNETEGIIGEVKNTNGKVYLSNQIKDDIAHAQANGLTFKLFVRSGATFSGPLQNAINNGAVTVVRF
jgi:RHS repeat-associated protein